MSVEVNFASSNYSGSVFPPTKEVSLKGPFLIIFHALATSTYAYALYWLSTSAFSSQVHVTGNSLMRPYGKNRFMTYNGLVIHFVSFLLSSLAHFIPRLTGPKDYFFTSITVPFGMLVTINYWGMRILVEKKDIMHPRLFALYPSWHDHLSHTTVMPVNLIEMFLVNHQYSSEFKSLFSSIGLIVAYGCYLLYIRFHTGRFVYPFMDKLDITFVVLSLIIGPFVYAPVAFRSSKLLHDFIHGYKHKLTMEIW